MAAARPIIWGSNSVNDPVTAAGCGFTVPPEDPEALARAIMEICNLSIEERREMGNRGCDYVMKYHAVSVLANKLLVVLEPTHK